MSGSTPPVHKPLLVCVAMRKMATLGLTEARKTLRLCAINLPCSEKHVCSALAEQEVNASAGTSWLVRELEEMVQTLARPALPPLPPCLSDREREVAVLLLDGASNKAIARELGISPATAKQHVAAVVRKLGVTSRAAAAPRLGALTPPADE